MWHLMKVPAPRAIPRWVGDDPYEVGERKGVTDGTFGESGPRVRAAGTTVPSGSDPHPRKGEGFERPPIDTVLLTGASC